MEIRLKNIPKSFFGPKHRPASHLLRHIRGVRGEVTKGRKIKAQKREGGRVFYAQDRVLVEEDCVSQQLVGGREGTLPGV